MFVVLVVVVVAVCCCVLLLSRGCCRGCLWCFCFACVGGAVGAFAVGIVVCVLLAVSLLHKWSPMAKSIIKSIMIIIDFIIDWAVLDKSMVLSSKLPSQ